VRASRFALRDSGIGTNAGLLVASVFLAPALIGLLVFRLAPIGVSVVGSLYGETLTGESVWRGIGNYERLLADPNFLNTLRTTLLFNLIINPFQVMIAFGLALLVFWPGPFISVFRVAFFLPMTLSIGLTAILWDILLHQHVGPLNALLADLGIGRQGFFHDADQALLTMIAVASWKGCGYWMVFLLAGLATIPEELFEAAKIDGATALQRFRHVTLPLMRRPLAFVLVADTAVNFVFFAPVFIITAGGPDGATDLMMFRAYELAFTFGDWGRSLALSTVILCLIAIVAAIELRFLRDDGTRAA
jgi:multiple sugar transport system permease protein